MNSADYVCLLCMKETEIPHQYPCPHCGGDDRTIPLRSPALPPRTVLDNRYVLGQTLGQGGFGITYQAYDLRMGNTVAVKEYFPTSLVGRDSNVSSTVTVNAIKGTRAREEYASGLRHFLFEARRQAKLANSPGVVSVTDFFEANNTAYYIMEFVDGSTLVRYLKKPIPIDAVLRLLEPIADSLMSIHEAGLIHRDISPDNIMCARNGQRKLLDFGASHSFTEEESTTGNATLKHGFAPPEQYGSSSMQGPWTDVYAFAATVYWCLTGKVPQDSMDRSIGGDRLRPASELGAVINPDAEAVLMRAMTLPVTARYQSMDVFWSKLKRAVFLAGGQHNRPLSSAEFSDPDGKTMTIPRFSLHEEEMEVPEHTKVPETAMERPEGSSKKRSSFPISARNLSFAPVEEDKEQEVGEEDVRIAPAPLKKVEKEPDLPDITLYQPSMQPKKSLKAVRILDEEEEEPSVMEEPPKKEPVKQETPEQEPVTKPTETEKPTHTSNRVVIALILVIAVLAVAFGYTLLNPPAAPQGSASSVVNEETVTIGGVVYPMDTTELHFIGNGSYTPLNRKGVEYTSLDYLSNSDWKSICKLTELRRLSLVGLALDDLTGMEALTELEILDVSGNQLTTLEPLRSCTALNEVYAADNRLTDFPPLPALVFLDLAGNKLSDVSCLTTLPRLSTLYLQKNAVTDPAPLAQLTALSTLDIANNHITDVSALTALTELKLLYLDGNHLTNAQLSNFHDKLPNCALDVDVLTDIPETVQIGKKSYSTKLTKLKLASSGLGNDDIQNLKYMVNLTDLDLSGNNLSDVFPLARLYSLTKLDLSYNKIEDISSLAGLYQLTDLTLSSNQIRDLAPLGHLTQLTELAIGNNLFTDISPLSNLTRMRTLVMCKCGKPDLTQIYPMQELFELRISKNVYSKEELAALKEAVPTIHINQYS